MANPFLVWVGAGVVAAGVSAATVAGAGAAAADDGSAGDGGRTATSDSPKTSDGQGDSGTKPPVSAEKVDGSLSNPDIRKIDDPIFDVNNVHDDGITDRRDPLISALYFEPEILKALPPTTIYVGEREILYPDTLLLHQRAVDEGAPISVVVGTGLVHDWPVFGSPPLGFSQSAAVRPDVYRELGLTSDA